MKHIRTKLSAIIISLTTFFSTLFISNPVFAASEGCVDTIFFGEQCGEDGIYAILVTVVNIMTIGIGILAAIGITVSGIQYLTAAGNEEQTRKSKRRIFEIVIGVFSYLIIYAILQWLLPDFHGLPE